MRRSMGWGDGSYWFFGGIVHIMDYPAHEHNAVMNDDTQDPAVESVSSPVMTLVHWCYIWYGNRGLLGQSVLQ